MSQPENSTIDKIRNAIALILTLCSLGLLYPGLTLDILNINISASLPLLGTLELFDQTQSIMSSIQSLFENGDNLVASLILFFSVIIPLIKALSLLAVISLSRWQGRAVLYRFINIIAKWSMADVFAVALMMTFLAANAHSSVTAQLHSGFYYFTAYCLISLLGTQIVVVKSR
ncbi:MAG: hypothetical protein COA42_04200 [Alteromonadaceae bacterium]|nr:MAG: hypothetical protein COA42_04200 [Alteromonadaceae bacterium]